MLTLHHLNDSRSQRIIWLLEELGSPYDLKTYQRDAQTRLAPPELEAVHPLGKAPVIVDGDVTIAGIRGGGGLHHPSSRPWRHAAGGGERRNSEAYLEWLHYAEGSAMLPLMLNLHVSRLK